MPSTPEGDQLLGVIRQLVHGRVHPAYEEATVEIVVTALVRITTEPQFYNHLRVVIDLQSQIIQLERALAGYQGRVAPAPVKKVVAKMAPAKP